MSRYKKGILSKDLRSLGGTIHKKGDTVKYAKVKTTPDRDGFKITNQEYHYLDLNGKNCIRSTELLIEGVPYEREPYIQIKPRLEP